MFKVLVNTNIIISGIFFEGLESEILDSKDIKLFTADICKEETIEVAERKFSDLSSDSLEKVIAEVEDAFLDIDVIDEQEYRDDMDEAIDLIDGENDGKVLAAVLSTQPDYFITGDEDFYTENIEERVNIVKSRELLKRMKREG